jgi:hypothetical protein
MAAKIDSLIDKQDNYEIVRDKVAQILADEIANQQTLAGNAGKDPALWTFTVYTERSNPFILARENAGGVTGENEIVNVWLDNSNFIDGNPVNRKQPTTAINIDCISVKSSTDNPAGGITQSADERASLDAERIGRLVRNILMADEYTYLDLRKTVANRWISRMQKFQPDRDDRPVENAMGFRVVLEVSHLEYSPQATPEDLELIITDIKRGETGEVLASVTVDTTLP